MFGEGVRKIISEISGKLQQLKEDVRIVKLPLEELTPMFKKYIDRINWLISKEENTQTYSKFMIRNPNASLYSLFLNNDPQISIWYFFPHSEGTRIKIFFELYEKTRFWFYALSIALFIAVQYTAYRFFSEPSNLSYFTTLLITICFAIILHSCISNVDRYRKFKEGFYSSLFEHTGLHETVIEEGFLFPELINYFFIVVFFLFSTLFFIVGNYLGLRGVSSLIFTVVIMPLLVAFLAILFLIILWRQKLTGRIGLALFGLEGASCLAVCSLLLVFIAYLGLKISESQINFIAFAIVMGIITVIVIFILKDIADMAVELITIAYKYKTDNPDSVFFFSPQTIVYNGVFTAGIFLTWFVFSVINVIGLYFSLSCLEYFLFSKNFIFRSVFIKIFEVTPASSVIAVILALPLIGFHSVFLIKHIRENRKISKLRKLHNVPKELSEKVKVICDYAGVKVPMIVITEEAIITSSVKLIIPFGKVLRISAKALELLNEREVEAFLAHEIYHLKKHSSLFNLLDLLSEWTLFGTGFLALIVNSKQIEFDADDFAMMWLNKRKSGREVFISLLNKTSVANSVIGHLAFSNSMLNFSETIKQENREKINWLKRARFVDQIFFGDIIVSYIHPTNKERIKRLESKFKG